LSDDEGRHEKAMVPLSSRGLITRSTRLVRRGLVDLVKAHLPPRSLEVNSLGMEFILIPSGTFMMGSDAKDDEKPVHEVNITKPFFMGCHPVTQYEWKQIMGSIPAKVFVEDDYPALGVTWDDAQEFISELNSANLQPTRTGVHRPVPQLKYRLPSEAEWEYACRAGTTGDYAGPLDSMAWYANNSGHNYLDATQIWEADRGNYPDIFADNGNRPHAVGTKDANAFGLYDMHGNMWEWCQDFYDENYYGNSASTDPEGPSSGEYRILRGDAWDDFAHDLRSAPRDWEPQGAAYAGFGLRLVAVVRTR